MQSAAGPFFPFTLLLGTPLGLALAGESLVRKLASTHAIRILARTGANILVISLFVIAPVNSVPSGARIDMTIN
jgi:hypothetical protein